MEGRGRVLLEYSSSAMELTERSVLNLRTGCGALMGLILATIITFSRETENDPVIEALHWFMAALCVVAWAMLARYPEWRVR